MKEPELEQQLRALRPVRPSRALEDRIARELAPLPAVRAGIVTAEKQSLLERLLPALGWTAFGAAAAVIAMLSLNLAGAIGPKHTGTDKPETQAPAVSPAIVESELLDASDEGLLDSGGSVARVVRYTSLERRSWTDAKGAVTLVEVPREDVVLLPVTVQ